MQFQIIKTNNLLSNTRYKIIPLYRRRIESETTQKVWRKISTEIDVFVEKKMKSIQFISSPQNRPILEQRRNDACRRCMQFITRMHYSNVSRTAQDFSPNPPRYRSPIPWNRSHTCQLWPSSSHKFCVCG